MFIDHVDADEPDDDSINYEWEFIVMERRLRESLTNTPTDELYKHIEAMDKYAEMQFTVIEKLKKEFGYGQRFNS